MKHSYRAVSDDFASQTQGARKVLLIDIGGLGDVIHALPAMWAVRQTYPNAELHCVVCEPWVSLLQMTPWIDRVWPYGGKQKCRRFTQWRQALQLRRQRFDVAISLMGSTRACLIARLSGAPRRLVRKPMEARHRAWRWLATEVMVHPYLQEPMYLQKWHCVRSAGFASAAPQLELRHSEASDQRWLEQEGLMPKRYLHLSPYTSGTHRELPPEQMLQLLCRLHQDFPQQPLVLSCAANLRECEALDALVAALPFRPWRVFRGSLDIPQLTTLIRAAAVHYGGDTGTTHLAWLTGTASVSGFYSGAQLAQWAPRGARHALVFSESPPPDYLRGIVLDDILLQTQVLLDAAQSDVERTSSDPAIASPRLVSFET